ncbi:MAG TPA: DUF4118 domain-containing protein [Blastocatellia bacterium]|nr:DUF4118 domain-containing protein [Blastocatellia bacterium]
MPTSNPFLWPRPPAIVSCGIAVLSVAIALIIGQWPPLHLQTAPVSLFLCAVIFSAWFGGAGPGLLAILLSVLAFDYYFLPPVHSLVPNPEEIPRLVIFTLSALFVGSLSAAQRSAAESLRRGRMSWRRQVTSSSESTKRCAWRLPITSVRRRRWTRPKQNWPTSPE